MRLTGRSAFPIDPCGALRVARWEGEAPAEPFLCALWDAAEYGPQAQIYIVEQFSHGPGVAGKRETRRFSLWPFAKQKGKQVVALGAPFWAR